MKVRPSEKIKIPLQEKIDKVTRVVAIVVAFLSTFGLFVKILFF